MCQVKGQRHIIICFVCCITKHHSLVTGTLSGPHAIIGLLGRGVHTPLGSVAVGTTASIGYVPGGDVTVNLEHFAVYTLVTSTLTWDTVRALTTTIGIIVAGPMILAALSRAKVAVRR